MQMHNFVKFYLFTVLFSGKFQGPNFKSNINRSMFTEKQVEGFTDGQVINNDKFLTLLFSSF